MTACIELDFSDLRGRIRSMIGTEGDFARLIGRTHGYVSKVFNGKAYFDANDILAASNVLEISNEDIGRFFYTVRVHKCEL